MKIALLMTFIFTVVFCFAQTNNTKSKPVKIVLSYGIDKYVVTKDSILYDPLKAEESNTGFVHNKKRKQILINQKTFLQIIDYVDAILKNTSIHTTKLEKGTVFLDVITNSKEKSVRLLNAKETEQFLYYLKKLLNN
mgnify:CR=1 FL=1